MTLFVFGIFLSLLMLSGIFFSLLFYNVAVSGPSAIILCISCSIFFIVGVIFACKGAKKLISDHQTDKYGTQAYGIVSDILPTGTSVNGVPELKANVFIYKEDGSVESYAEVIGFSADKYKPGDFLLVKHYKNDINILQQVNQESISDEVKTALCEAAGVHNNTSNLHIDGNMADTIIIDGTEYVRKR